MKKTCCCSIWTRKKNLTYLWASFSSFFDVSLYLQYLHPSIWLLPHYGFLPLLFTLHHHCHCIPRHCYSHFIAIWVLFCRRGPLFIYSRYLSELIETRVKPAIVRVCLCLSSTTMFTMKVPHCKMIDSFVDYLLFIIIKLGIVNLEL